MQDFTNISNNGLLSIGESSEYLGISIDTLRRWEKKGKIVSLRSPGGHRYFKKDDLDTVFGRKYERDPETKPRQKKENISSNILETSNINAKEDSYERQSASESENSIGSANATTSAYPANLANSDLRSPFNQSSNAITPETPLNISDDTTYIQKTTNYDDSYIYTESTTFTNKPTSLPPWRKNTVDESEIIEVTTTVESQSVVAFPIPETPTFQPQPRDIKIPETPVIKVERQERIEIQKNITIDNKEEQIIKETKVEENLKTESVLTPPKPEIPEINSEKIIKDITQSTLTNTNNSDVISKTHNNTNGISTKKENSLKNSKVFVLIVTGVIILASVLLTYYLIKSPSTPISPLP